MTQYKTHRADDTATGDASVRIRFTNDAWSKMWQYTFSVKEEISGYGRVKVFQDSNGSDIFLVDDVAIFKQTVSGADTEIDAGSVASFMHEMHKRGENPAEWRLWWHSHNNMAVFWSGTDETAMSPENNIGKDWLISVVVNFKRHTKGRLDVYSPTHLTLDDVIVETEGDSFEIPQAIRDEVNAKVTQRVYPQYQTAAGFKTVNGKSQLILPYSAGAQDPRYEDEDEYFGAHYGAGYHGIDVPARDNVAGRPLTSVADVRMEQLRVEFDAMAGDEMSAEDFLLARDVYCGNTSKLSNKQVKRGKKILRDNNLDF